MSALEEGLKRYLGEEKLKKIQQVKVGIAGTGGLGSNCAFNLVRSGFKKFILADYDLIEASNLNRQFYFASQVGEKKVMALKKNLLEINPQLEIELFPTEINSSNAGQIFSSCDVVVEAFDKAEAKQMLVEEYLNSNKLLVAASGLAGWGDSDKIQVHHLKKNFYLIGDLVSAIGPNCPPLSPRVNIAAAKQADVILDYVLKGEKE